MALLQRASRVLKVDSPLFYSSLRSLCTEVSEPPKPAAAPQPDPTPQMVYNSPATPADPVQPVGPGAKKTSEYPNPEYYSYNKMSYFDLEVEMVPDRIVQPKANNGHL